jgi:hypothetical protein
MDNAQYVHKIGFIYRHGTRTAGIVELISGKLNAHKKTFLLPTVKAITCGKTNLKEFSTVM